MISKYMWNKVEDGLPEDKVVLAACNTYDCGWVMDTVWWNARTKRWFLTGTNDTQQAYLPYTHWRELPPDPDFEKEGCFDEVSYRDYYLGPDNRPAPVVDTLPNEDKNMNIYFLILCCIITATMVWFMMV